MKTNILNTLYVTIGALSLMAQGACGGLTNTIPWADSFEAYPHGQSINGTNGWTSDTPAGGAITTDTAVTDLLTNYPVSGRSYPLSSATHTSVLQITTLVTNMTHSVSGGVVVVDFMAMPDWVPIMPRGDTGSRMGFCVSTNGLLTIWHHTTSPATNLWLELTNSPVISSNAWNRFTVLQDNSNKLFQVRVNEGTPLTDGRGWSAGGTSQPGSWFRMVQTNPSMSRLVAAGVCSYLDDVMVGKRTLTWSGTNFTERMANDGTIDNSAPLQISLTSDIFTGTVGDNLVASSKMIVSGLPPNLTAIAELTSSTNVSVTLAGVASAHEGVNSTSLSIQFADAAFALGSAWDVTGNQTNARLAFLDTPILTYSTNHFNESGANNGAIDNSSPILINLSHGTFAGAVDENFATNGAKLVISNLPAGLTGEVVVVSSTQLRFRLLGQATQNEVVNNVETLTLTFQDGAFNTVPASSVFSNFPVFRISYNDSSTLTYGTTVFTEMVANDGSVNGTTLTLANKAFDAAEGVNLVAGSQFICPNLPAGLGLEITRGASAQQATLTFTGKATMHAAANSLFTLAISFQDSAFVGGNAAAVANGARSNLQMLFADPRTLSYSGSSFTEISGGIIDNRSPVTITLAGDTLTGVNGDNFVPSKITAGNLPAGLSAQITRISATQLSVQLIGAALVHSNGASVANVSFTFHDEAFASGNASHVVNYVKTAVVVTFQDEVGFYNVVPYVEPFEAYAPGTLLAGTNGWSALNAADAIITNDASVTSNLLAYSESHLTFPVTGTHTQVLFVQGYVQNAVHSEAAGLVYVDFMTLPVPMQAAPEVDTNKQVAFYVSTNGQLVIWHHNTEVSPATNQWLVLTNSSLINTSSWVRFTVTQDYVNNMFKIQINGESPASDPVGWSLPTGGSRPGPWFHMVQTNQTMSAFGIAGVGTGYLDDLTVRIITPDFGLGVGSVFTIR